MREHAPTILGVAIGSGGGMLLSQSLRVQIGWAGTIAAGVLGGALIAAIAIVILRRVL